jgi:protein-S-isoprenylcysteine O-methyltransferase Ste14
MTDRQDQDNLRRSPAARRALVRCINWLIIYMALMAISLFGPAGLSWTRGWIFLAVYLLSAIAATYYLWRVNPEILIARSTLRRPSKWWDAVIMPLLLASMAAIFPVAAYDNGRAHWSQMPLAASVLGYIFFVLANAGSIWVMRVNKFAEPSVRIQTERHQQVIDTGPYAIVRHPLYSTMFLFFVGIPLALGSYWALIPGGVCVGLLVVRTAFEDRLLRQELAGYESYASRVRYRLVPGVW